MRNGELYVKIVNTFTAVPIDTKKKTYEKERNSMW